jgi:hypothetical protein
MKGLEIWKTCKKIVDTTYLWKPYEKIVIPPKIDRTIIYSIEKEINNDIDLYIRKKLVPTFQKSGILNERALYCRNSAAYADMARNKLDEIIESPELIKSVLNVGQNVSDIELCRSRYLELYHINKKFMTIFMII